MRLEFVAHMLGIILTIAVIVYVSMVYIFTVPRRPPSAIEVTPVTEVIGTPTEVVVGNIVYLPLPRKITNVVVEEAILWRRSIREYTSDPISIENLAMLLWAAYGVTDTIWGLRACPSAGATYPLEVYVVVGEKSVIIEGDRYLEAGVYKYDIYTHTLRLIRKGDFRGDLARAALDQPWVKEAPINIVVTAVYERTTRIYGERGASRYVPMEVGHLGQNVYLMATALGLGTVVVGAFFDHQVSEVIRASAEEVPLYIIPVGVPKDMRITTFEDIQSYILRNR
ncbi:MAG: SagB/ThcOx family dehydrogenase [Ignisphaera sp.]